MVTTYYFLLYAQRVDGVAPRGGPAASILNFTVSIGGEGFNGMRDEGRNARCRFGTLEVPAYYSLTTRYLLLTNYHLTPFTHHLRHTVFHFPLPAYLLTRGVGACHRRQRHDPHLLAATGRPGRRAMHPLAATLAITGCNRRYLGCNPFPPRPGRCAHGGGRGIGCAQCRALCVRGAPARRAPQ